VFSKIDKDPVQLNARESEKFVAAFWKRLPLGHWGHIHQFVADAIGMKYPQYLRGVKRIEILPGVYQICYERQRWWGWESNYISKQEYEQIELANRKFEAGRVGVKEQRRLEIELKHEEQCAEEEEEYHRHHPKFSPGDDTLVTVMQDGNTEYKIRDQDGSTRIEIRDPNGNLIREIAKKKKQKLENNKKEILVEYWLEGGFHGWMEINTEPSMILAKIRIKHPETPVSKFRYELDGEEFVDELDSSPVGLHTFGRYGYEDPYK